MTCFGGRVGEHCDALIVSATQYSLTSIFTMYLFKTLNMKTCFPNQSVSTRWLRLIRDGQAYDDEGSGAGLTVLINNHRMCLTLKLN